MPKYPFSAEYSLLYFADSVLFTTFAAEYNHETILTMSAIIGRKQEMEELERLYRSDRPEFVAVYGRRRVGKTFLIKQALKDRITFQHTGVSPIDQDDEKSRMKTQLESFYYSMLNHGLEDIIACCKKLVSDYDGEVPSDIDALTSLPGVGRKTANVIRGNIFHEPSVVVDTHVGRLARRLGLSRNEDPEKVEYDLMKKLPKDHWISCNTQLIALGRTICSSRKPKCAECFLKDICDTGRKNTQKNPAQ